MAVIGGILMGIGYLGALICAIILLVKAFQTSVGWGIASLLIPFALLVFAIKNWDICKKPFLISIVCSAVAVAGGVAAGVAAGAAGGGMMDALEQGLEEGLQEIPEPAPVTE